jgi:stage II sporulation protein AA (anti-sigma F factor antagonist)
VHPEVGSRAVGDGERHGPDGGAGSLSVVDSRRVEDALVLSFSGDLDMVTSPQLYLAVVRCLAEGEHRQLIVDLTEVRFLSSSGLQALLAVRDLTKKRGLWYRLVVGSNRYVTRPLEITGLTAVLTLHRSLGDALGDQAAVGDLNC